MQFYCYVKNNIFSIENATVFFSKWRSWCCSSICIYISPHALVNKGKPNLLRSHYLNSTDKI